MYDWVRALLDPVDIVQRRPLNGSPITPPPTFELPIDEPKSLQITLEITALVEATKITPSSCED
jgi:hypothetical protein